MGSELAIVAVHPLQPSLPPAASPAPTCDGTDWPTMPNMDELISDSDLDVTPPKSAAPSSPFAKFDSFEWANALALGSPETPARPTTKTDDYDDDNKLLEECMVSTPLTAARHGITKSARPKKAAAKSTRPKQKSKEILSI